MRLLISDRKVPVRSAAAFQIRVLIVTLLLFLGGVFVHAGQVSTNVPGVVDLEGRSATPFTDSIGAKLIVLVFTRTDCPVANRYAPEIQRLQAAFAQRGVTFWLVYPDQTESPSQIRQHLHDYGYVCGALRDPRHMLVKRAGVSVTPEAAIFRPDGVLLYPGRIDDSHADYGKTRPAPTRRELADALVLALDGKCIPPAQGLPVGCLIEAAQP